MTFLELLKQKGKTLVLQGPEGCGKSLLARQLVEGNHSVTSLDLIKRDKFQSWLTNSPNVVIVEGSPKRALTVAIKPLIASEKMLRHQKGKEPELIKTPTFIFCTSDPEPFNPAVEGRRFFVIKMGS